MKEGATSIQSSIFDAMLCGGFSGGQLTTSTIRYYSLPHAFQTIVKEEGPRALFGGFTAACYGAFISHSAYFLSYEFLKRKLQHEYKVNETSSYLISGAVGDIIASLIYVPTEVLKTRLQLQGTFKNPSKYSQHHYKSTLDALKQVYSHNGFLSFYEGLGATFLRDIPMISFQFTFYETIQNAFLRNKIFTNYNNVTKLHELTVAHDMFAGAVAGTLAGAITTPLDVVKTYLQTQKQPPKLADTLTSVIPPSVSSEKISNSVPKPRAPAFYNGIISALVGIYKTEGLKGLYYGVGARSIYLGTQSMIMFVLYENLLRHLRVYRMESGMRNFDELNSKF
ncbi:hypothetical protein HK099_006373 [Clydaea vesicula]|uniref:Uncharacterized protein n=1 Tax=Clydaea vesicula TaxID=447962 RepID=A0AAD5XYA1_9FUNG|nr:hypothetical protein HK099_006373 [Clydaea vesicula]